MDPSVSTLHQRFSEVAARQPSHPALLAGQRAVSYEELDVRSTQWAAVLARSGAGPGEVVAVHLPRSVELVIAVLGTLKTGAAYTLLDPDWPAARLQQAQEAVNAKALITEGSLEHLEQGVGGRFAPISAGPDSPACVFFTSGTTGTPKAVLTPHGALLRLFVDGSFMRSGPDLVIAAAAALPWDAFALELWSALATGGTAVLISERYLTTAELRSVVTRSRVNTAWLTSSLFNLIVDEDLDAFHGLTELLIGGERLSVDHVRRFLLRHSEAIRLVNGYGPVEATVFATTHDITLSDADRRGGIPLGLPVPQTVVQILAQDTPVPTGTVGEIVIGGRGLAIGYLGDPEATRDKFVTLPGDGQPTRYYRTGDLGHVDADRVLHYAGRMDRQVKIRGLRVEPAEIEAVITAELPVSICRVVATPHPVTGDMRLIAFCVPHHERPQGDLTERLRAVLLPQQVPKLVWVEYLPLSPTGKLDEAALVTELRDSIPDVLPSASVKDKVRAAIRSVLAAPIDDETSFFVGGGNSLDAGRVSARLSRALDRPVPVNRIYEAPTVSALTRLLEHGSGEVSPFGVLTPMQRIFLLKSLLDPGDLTNHCLLTWRIDGPLDRTVLRRALDHLHRSQPMLHSTYGIDSGVVLQPSLPSPPLRELSCADAEGAQAALHAEMVAPFDPSTGPVWRPVLATWGSQHALLGLAFHHVAFDGASEAIVARELSTAYKYVDLTGGTVPVRARAAAVDVPGNLLRDLQGVPEIQWPDDRLEDGGVREFDIVLPLKTVDASARLATRAGTTRFAVLLHAWGLAIAEVCETDDFAVGVPMSLRDGEVGDDVGCHMTTVAVRLSGAALVDDDSGRVAVGELWRRAVAERDTPLTEVLRSASRSHRPPVFQNMLALQDHPPPKLELPGVETEFVRTPYLALPLELHVELWPQASGDLRATVSYRADAVSRATADRCIASFAERLRTATDDDETKTDR